MKILNLSLAVCAMAFLNIYCGSASDIDYSRTTYYVSSSGSASGGGSSWNDALDTKSFVNVLANMDSIHEHTFYLTKGVYKMEDDSIGQGVHFNVKKNVTIRGGYSPSGSSDGYSIDNKTILIAGDSASYLMTAHISSNKCFSVYDVCFEGKIADSSNMNASSVSVTAIPELCYDSTSFHFERCSFSQNSSFSTMYGSGTFNQCDFDFSKGGSISVYGGLDYPFNILSCSFLGSNCLFFTADNRLRIENCTFGGDNGKPIEDDGISHTLSIARSPNADAADVPVAILAHNTILGSVSISDNIRSWLNGNFIDGALISSSHVEIDSLGPQCNVYVNRGFSFKRLQKESTLDPKFLPYLFDYEDSVYSVEKVKGQRTKCIKLKKDACALSEYNCFLFRIPLSSELTLSKDQLGQGRYSAPCYGAYEYPFVERKDYYVKNGGDGDGSSWKRAMGSSDFFNYFQIAPASSTFHFAEGIYTPRQFALGTTNTSYPCFFTRRYVNLQGGYPPSPKNGDRPKPFVYHTVFSGDPSRDDILDDDDRVGKNVSVIEYCLSEDGEATVSGIDFRWQYNDEKLRDFAAAAVVRTLSQDSVGVIAKLNFEKCSFRNCTNGIFSNAQTLSVKECLFEKIRFTGVKSETKGNLSVESCTFHDCDAGVSGCYAKDMRIYNSTFLQNSLAFHIDIPEGGSLTLANNTVMDSYRAFSSAGKSKLNMVGNIMHYPAEGDISEASIKEFKSTNNLLLSNYLNELRPSAKLSANDFTTISDFYSVVENTMLVEDRLFPVLSYENSDFPPTIPLSLDMTQDSVDLRFPLEETPVTADQWGQRRGARTCMGAYEFQGEYPFIPSAFTPYSPNGKNDIFMKGYEVYIYNRYGLLLCHSKNGWDGFYKGKLVEPGVYVYVVVTRLENRKGTVEVVKSN